MTEAAVIFCKTGKEPGSRSLTLIGVASFFTRLLKEGKKDTTDSRLESVSNIKNEVS